MTRINLVSPESLTDQHLMAEYRELPRVFGAVRKRLSENKPFDDIPSTFRLGSGHVKFFYDKIQFLYLRQVDIINECLKRNIKISITDVDVTDIPVNLLNDYSPSSADINLSRSRLDEKISMKPNWYKFYGKPLIGIDND